MPTKHTPGPWWARWTGVDDYFVAGAGKQEIKRELTRSISREDARLIAAAPAMLEALLDALPYVEDVLSDPDALACFKPGTVERHAKAIRAAIAAATTGFVQIKGRDYE